MVFGLALKGVFLLLQDLAKTPAPIVDLNVSYTNVTSKALESLISKCSTIENLGMASARGASDATVRLIAESPLKLGKLSIAGCSNIKSPSVFLLLALRKKQTLERLNWVDVPVPDKGRLDEVVESILERECVVCDLFV